jgi:hypothetical protein
MGLPQAADPRKFGQSRPEETMFRRTVHALVATLPLLAACASSSPRSMTARPRTDIITREEIDQVGARNAYEAVERLRPRWLVVRSGMRSFSMETEVVVFHDQLFLGNQNALRAFGIDGIYEIRYVDGPTAKATLPGLGDRHVQGAIVIHMSPP